MYWELDGCNILETMLWAILSLLVDNIGQGPILTRFSRKHSDLAAL